MLLRLGCRVGPGWSAFPCCACGSGWPVLVPCRLCSWSWSFACFSLRLMRFGRHRPKNRHVFRQIPPAAVKPDGVLTPSILGKHYVCYCCSGTSVSLHPEASRRRYLGQCVQVDLSDFRALLRGSHRPLFLVTARQCVCRDQYSQPFFRYFGVTAFQLRSIGKDTARDFGWLHHDGKGQATIEHSNARDVLYHMIRAECCPVAPCRFARSAAIETAVSVTTSSLLQRAITTSFWSS